MDVKKIILFLTVIYSTTFAQTEDNIFPGETGQQLLDNLIASYKTSSTIGERAGKDSMYASIYNINDSVSCVYTDFTMYIDPALDPSQAAYIGGAGINCEHTWPKAKGASSGLAEWDLHHLFPTRVDVNGYRGNSPFDEIDDNQTYRWYWLDSFTTSIPSLFIDEYSEWDNTGIGRFEPREDHKGNVDLLNLQQFNLYQNYPNPFNPSTQIRYYIPTGSKVVLVIFNVLGQQIYSMENQHGQAGEYTFNWNGVDMSGNKAGSGMYFYRIDLLTSKSNRISEIRKMILLQ
jgi:FlgD Ig-like domain/Endonuclease I